MLERFKGSADKISYSPNSVLGTTGASRVRFVAVFPRPYPSSVEHLLVELEFVESGENSEQHIDYTE